MNSIFAVTLHDETLFFLGEARKGRVGVLALIPYQNLRGKNLRELMSSLSIFVYMKHIRTFVGCCVHVGTCRTGTRARHMSDTVNPYLLQGILFDSLDTIKQVIRHVEEAGR